MNLWQCEIKDPDCERIFYGKKYNSKSLDSLNVAVVR